MMANSAKDPLWRAKVSHEGLVNPAHKEVLEDVCTSCHAAAGNKNAHHQGMSLYTLDDLENDPLGLDGVQCTVCHQITDESMGNYSGTFNIGTSKTIWGPYIDPFSNPMINNTGYTPAHGDHINSSLLCASCHTRHASSGGSWILVFPILPGGSQVQPVQHDQGCARLFYAACFRNPNIDRRA